MKQTRAERQLNAMRLAQDCAALGARVRTIHHLTGLNPRDVQRLFFNDPLTIPRGRPPNSLEWYHSANLIAKTESSICMSIYRRLRITGFGAAEALVSAYRGYRGVCQRPLRVSFDRAFDLASHTDGIWLSSTSVFEVLSCPACDSDVLMAIGSLAHSGEHCPFCKLVQRYSCDPRLQALFPKHEFSASSESID